MKQIDEITVFTHGNSNSLRTWSNVPFLLTKTMEEKGITVNRVDISPLPRLEHYFNRTVGILIGKIFPGNRFDYYRSIFHRIHCSYLINGAVKKHPNSDVLFFISFSIGAKSIKGKRVVQFSDWTFEYYFNHFLNRKPNFFERQTIKSDRKVLRSADLMITLFPAVFKYLQKKHFTNARYLGNVINAVEKASIDDVSNHKSSSNKILFIGRSEYLQGAQQLIQAFVELKKSDDFLELHIIGMVASHFSKLPEGVVCHGYLDKSIVEQKNKYYELLRTCRVFVNTNPKWSAFSATVEAMYFYNPIIIPPHKDFVETFGNELDGGIYYNEGDDLSALILKVFEQDNYQSMATAAHDTVKDMTWSRYIDKVVFELMKLD